MMRGIEMKRKKAHHSWPQSEAIRGRRGFMVGGGGAGYVQEWRGRSAASGIGG